MPVIIVDINEKNQEVVLSGDIEVLVNNRFARRFLKDYLAPQFKGSYISIPIDEENPEKTFASIKSLLRKYGLEEQQGAKAKEVLADFEEENSKFSAFSEKALSIRNNNRITDGLELFTSVLDANLSGRRLFPFQLLAAYHLAFSQNACNFSVPGAGKTSIVYGAYSYLKSLQAENVKKVDCILVIGPLSSFAPWEMEYEECFSKKPSSTRLAGAVPRAQKAEYLLTSNPAELTLVSYDSVPSIVKELGWFLQHHRVMVVLDEAHRIKNTSGGIRADAVLSLAKYAKSRVVLTGTPAPNGYEDLFNMFQFIWPTKSVIGFRVNQLKDMSSRQNDPRVETLIKNVSPFFIRIKKSDLNLPSVTINPVIRVDMLKEQRTIYDWIEETYIESMIKEGGYQEFAGIKSKIAQAKTIRLMQAATNPSMLLSPLSELIMEEDAPLETYQAIDDRLIIEQIMKYSKTETPAKYFAAKELAKQLIEKGEKVIIWATFVETIKTLSAYLESYGMQNKMLYGATPIDVNAEAEVDNEIETREKIIRDFHREDCEFNIVIANPAAVAESISLHKTCHNAIYIERSFNAAHFMQSKDRIHRVGLGKGVETNYFFLASANSIDETIDERLAAKETRMIEVVESMPIPIFSDYSSAFGNEDLKAIISDYIKRSNKA